jgi:hypothetical protein
VIFLTKEEKKAIDELWRFDCCYNEQIKAILNLIEKQQAELEKYKYLYQKALDNTIKADKENIQKDKIIERIYDFIWENDCCRYFSKKHTMCNQVLNFDSCLGNCKRHCINKYFEKKVREEND